MYCKYTLKYKTKQIIHNIALILHSLAQYLLNSNIVWRIVYYDLSRPEMDCGTDTKES